MENHQRKKDWRPLATPVPLGQASCCVHVECQHLPFSGLSPPPPPQPVSEIAH